MDVICVQTASKRENGQEAQALSSFILLSLRAIYETKPKIRAPRRYFRFEIVYFGKNKLPAQYLLT